MVKNDNTIYWIIGIVIFFLVVTNLLVQKEEMIGLTPHFYKDGVEVFPSKGLFSIVTGPGISGNYDQILFDISATNKDVPMENIKIVDAYPQVFKDAIMSLTPQTLNPGQTKKLWGVGDYVAMDTTQFEGQTINFWVNVSGTNEYAEETVYAEAYSGDITFEAEVLARINSPIEGEVLSGIIPICWENAYDNYIKYLEGSCQGLSGGTVLAQDDGTTGSGCYNWDTTTVSNGAYCIKLTFGEIKDSVSVTVDNGEGTYIGELFVADNIPDPYGFGTLGMVSNGNYIWINGRYAENVYKYDMLGNYQGSWSLKSSSSDNMGNVYDLSIDEIYIYALDYNVRRICKYGLSGNHQGCFTLSTSVPYSMATDGTNIFIVDYYGNLYKYDMSGNYQGLVKDLGISNSRGMTTDGTNIWVVRSTSVIKKVYKYDMVGNLQTSWNLNGEPIGIANYENYILVLDTNMKVHKYIG